MSGAGGAREGYHWLRNLFDLFNTWANWQTLCLWTFVSKLKGKTNIPPKLAVENAVSTKDLYSCDVRRSPYFFAQTCEEKALLSQQTSYVKDFTTWESTTCCSSGRHCIGLVKKKKKKKHKSLVPLIWGLEVCKTMILRSAKNSKFDGKQYTLVYINGIPCIPYINTKNIQEILTLVRTFII